MDCMGAKRVMEEEQVTEIPVLFCGILAGTEDMLLEAETALVSHFGCIARHSEIIPFDFTNYYEEEMGPDLLRRFVTFEREFDPAGLADAKLATCTMEQSVGRTPESRCTRSVNLDPGYITASRLVLATTKNFAHRIYLRDGIYAEVTMTFRKDGCVYLPWTYPDFKSAPYREFFLAVRADLLSSESRGFRKCDREACASPRQKQP